MIRKVSAVVVICGVILGLGVWQRVRPEPTTTTRMFCAYNTLFVEFEEAGKIWGTTFLDRRGRPIPCVEEPVNNTQGTIRGI